MAHECTTHGLPMPHKQNPEWYTTHTTTTICYHLSCCTGINIIVVAYVLLLFIQGKVQSPPHNIICGVIEHTHTVCSSTYSAPKCTCALSITWDPMEPTWLSLNSKMLILITRCAPALLYTLHTS